MILSTLRTDTRYLISPQLTSTQYTDAQVNRNLNIAYRTVLAWVLTIEGDWEISGDVLYKDFEAGVTVYALPANLIRIYKGEVMYTTGGSFVPLNFISVQANQGSVEGNVSRVFDDPGTPTAELFADEIEIRPAPDETVVNGIKIWAQLVFEDLSDGADTEVPELLEPVQRAISLLAAIDYAVSHDMFQKANELRKMLFGDSNKIGDTGIKGLVENLYSIRLGSRRDNLRARRGRRFK